MGMVYALMEVGDPAGERFIPFRGLVDTGAFYSTLPTKLLGLLGLSPTGTDDFELADGRSIERGYTVAMLRYDGDTVRVPVIFDDSNSQQLIGATALESFGLVVDPVFGRLAPASKLMGWNVNPNAESGP